MGRAPSRAGKALNLIGSVARAVSGPLTIAMPPELSGAEPPGSKTRCFEQIENASGTVNPIRNCGQRPAEPDGASRDSSVDIRSGCGKTSAGNAARVVARVSATDAVLRPSGPVVAWSGLWARSRQSSAGWVRWVCARGGRGPGG